MEQYDESYYNQIKIHNSCNQNVEFCGEVIIDCNSFCEGIIFDDQKNKYFIFGIYDRLNYLELFLVLDDKIKRYVGKMTYLKYEGKCETIQDELITSTNDFYISVRGLNVDPRDYGYEDNPKTIFKQNLEKFKDIWLLNDNNKIIYEKYFNNDVKKKKI